MATRFAVVSDEEIVQMKEDCIPLKTKKATKFGVKIFRGNNSILVVFIKKKHAYANCFSLNLACCRRIEIHVNKY